MRLAAKLTGWKIDVRSQTTRKKFRRGSRRARMVDDSGQVQIAEENGDEEQHEDISI